ncbi:hypothetical protein BC936DRAFT_149287 [Jimgerdemannia flammicorona]|uniref:Tyrosine specific protein phosphatases domain-containing protein n=1 Tax=Jimgerdemannia flammicorona TaxID=994334 RepID=A0A433D152_9FUNG|nr:hypothetical protein BC936DRAFT_149287 [Jimgerdemannia flammicorona]
MTSLSHIRARTSPGAIVSLRYAVTHNRSIPHLVNISARFYMIGLKANHDERIEAMLETQGFYDRHARFNGKQISRKVTKEEVELFCNWDNYFAKDMPLTTSVLTCHGLADTLVPVRDSAAYANLIPIHTLHLIEGADHNYNGCYPELASIVSQYFTNEAAKEAFWQHGAGVTVRVPRWIQVEGVRNFRDLGGWPVRPTSDGVGEGWHFKERMIFRSGDVTNITNEGVMTLYQLNIRTIFDFRSDTEVENAGGVRDIPGIQRVAVPIFKSIDYSPEALVIRWQDYFGGADGFAKAYHEILHNGPPHFRPILQHIARHPHSPVLVHCTAGKDRTGVLCMLLLGLCGVDDEIICREYELTERGFWVEDEKVEQLAKILNKTPEDILQGTLSARYDAMHATLRLFRQTYGSFEAYACEQCGMSMGEVEALRRALVFKRGMGAGALGKPKL